VRLGVAGKINTPTHAVACLEAGVDFVILGRVAILHHDFPNQVLDNPDFKPVETPVTEDYLRSQGLGEVFIEYMAGWDGFVKN
jgi:2,4-dienoyl-CoA reductase-like NADH-dependent reductase (Old Yellow Enzyme family)